MDINICIDRLKLNSNVYKLNQSNPPHEITFWEGDDSQPADSELETAWNDYLIEYNALEYARNRQAEYPSIADLVVALYDTDDKSAVEAKRAAVKAKYPKPE